ncbi:MAG: carboxypeptidase-like regulatory domain-containing protein [Bryobacteraceae bacterium]
MKDASITLRLTIFLFGALSLLGAQPTTRTVEGVVMDQHSHPLAHAAVQIENEWTLQIRSYITQADGKYHFAGLNGDDDYQITAEYDGVRSHVRKLSKFDSREEPRIDVTIRFGN